MNEVQMGRAQAAGDLARGVRMGDGCVLHRHREWVPVEQHHVWPLGMGGPDVPSNRQRVCANGHYAVHAYLDYLCRYGPAIPWPIRRHFGPVVRDMALRGWLAAGSPRR